MMKRLKTVVVVMPFLLLAVGLVWNQAVISHQITEMELQGSVTQAEELKTVNSPRQSGNPSVPDLTQLSSAESNVTLVSSSGSVTPISVAVSSRGLRQQKFCVKGLKAKASTIYVAIFESEDGFPKSERSSQTIVIPVEEAQASFSLELPCNQPIAIAVFQDIDGNGSLSKNQFGIPVEPYGFSNDARGRLGPPSFNQATFTLTAEADSRQPLEINLR